MDARRTTPGGTLREIELDAPQASTGNELAGRGLLDAVLEATQAAPPGRTAPPRRAAADALQEFLGESSPWQALALWLRRSGALRGRLTRDHVARLLSRDIARLDALLSRQ